MSEIYDYVFDLLPGEPLIIDKQIRVHCIRSNKCQINETKFAIHAPQEVCIMRLELFAKNIQPYDQILEVEYGEQIPIKDKELNLYIFPAQKHHVKIGVDSKKKVEVKNAYFLRKNR